MRCIIFRGMTEDKRWIEGSLVDQNGYYISTLPRLGKKNRGVYTFDDFEKVLPETVGQYAGRMDTNKTKIFDGDIVKTRYFGKDDGGSRNFDEYDTYTVEWVGSGFCIKNKTGIYGLFNDDESIEVIGNIHENKELLEG